MSSHKNKKDNTEKSVEPIFATDNNSCRSWSNATEVTLDLY